MKRYLILLVLWLVLIPFIAAVIAQDGGSKLPKDAMIAVIPAPESSRLKWENHRLRAANFRLQADSEEKDADRVLAEMQAMVGDRYAPRMSQAGVLEFALKAEPPVKKESK